MYQFIWRLGILALLLGTTVHIFERTDFFGDVVDEIKVVAGNKAYNFYDWLRNNKSQ